MAKGPPAVVLLPMALLCGCHLLGCGEPRGATAPVPAEREARRLPAARVFEVSGEILPWEPLDLDGRGILYAVVQYRSQNPDTPFLVAVDNQTGSERWATPLPTMQKPQVACAPNGAVLVYDPGAGLLSYGSETGEPLRSCTLPGWGQADDPMEGSGVSAISVHADGVLLLSSRGLSLVEPATWEPRWSLPLACYGKLVTYDPPTAAGERVFAIVDGAGEKPRTRRLLSVDARSGRLLWEADLGPMVQFFDVNYPFSAGGCAATAKDVVSLQFRATYWNWEDGATDGIAEPLLVCFDAATGRRRWQVGLPGLPAGWGGDHVSSPAMCDGFALVSMRKDDGCAYALASGALARRLSMEEQPTVHRDRMVVLGGPTRDQLEFLAPPRFASVLAVGLRTGGWSSFWGDPRVVSGRVVVLGRDLTGEHHITRVAVVETE